MTSLSCKKLPFDRTTYANGTSPASSSGNLLTKGYNIYIQGHINIYLYTLQNGSHIPFALTTPLRHLQSLDGSRAMPRAQLVQPSTQQRVKSLNLILNHWNNSFFGTMKLIVSRVHRNNIQNVYLIPTYFEHVCEGTPHVPSIPRF